MKVKPFNKLVPLMVNQLSLENVLVLLLSYESLKLFSPYLYPEFQKI